ncbi:MAG: hypothetical protein JETT_3716 [Candidatus Jettenia ecosi]|uniref:Uncharacterized protein n=1 Tax=Candidatus Jettenia ecosi TaxID=2494326 RepID=A0A533Q626_9BACT|nr:MAG: hypothetical protein JETT_3716 [Candidatus Jettenia ecosi]
MLDSRQRHSGMTRSGTTTVDYANPKPVCFLITRVNRRFTPISVVHRMLLDYLGKTGLEMVYAQGSSSQKNSVIISPLMLQVIHC